VAAVSYYISLGGSLETVTAGTAAPTAGTVEIRMDQTTNAVTDAAYSGGTRAPRKGEIYTLIEILTQYLIRDTNVLEP
jgi:hypothetical protein